MATNKALKFIKVDHFSSGTTVNERFTSALGTEAAIIYAPDVHEIWIGGDTAEEAVCVVKGASNVAFDSGSKILSVTTTSAGQQTTQTLNFSDVASGSATLKVFENVYGLIGSTPAEGVQTLDYSTTNYLKAGGKQDATHNYTNAAASLVAADIRLDEQIKRLDDAIGGSSVVNSLDGVSGTILTGNGLNVDVVGQTGNETKTLNIIPETGGYIVTSQTVGADAKTGINIADSKIEKNYTTANTTNLATVASITSALNTLDVSTDTGAASVSGSAITINAVQQENGTIKDGGTTTINLEGTYNASTNKIATQSTVTNAINALDVPANGEGAITGMGAGKTIATLTETDGKIAATFQDISITSSQISDLASTYSSTGTVAVNGTAVADAISTLDTTNDVVIPTLTGTTLTINGVKEVDGIVSATANPQLTLEFKTAPTTGANANKIITEADLSGIVGAMVYQGTVDSTHALPDSPQKGWVYVVSEAGTYSGKACEVGDMIVYNGTSWDVINGENQVTNGNATIVAGSDTASTIATVDGTNITAKVSVTAGSATIASKSGNVVTLKAGVTQTGTTGTIGNDSASDITLDDVAVTGAAADVSIADAGGIITAETVEGALQEIAAEINAMDVTGYAQATIAAASGETPTTSVLTIKGISETDGKIAADTSSNLDVNVDGVYDASTNMIATQSTVTNAINALDATVDADVTSGEGVPHVTQSTPSADFEVLNSVTQTDGKLASGTAYTLKKLAATAAATDMTVTSAVYGTGNATDNAQTALTNLASAITSAAITIDGFVGTITTGNGLTDVTANGGSFAVKIDSSNANGLSVGANGVAMAIATGSTFGTVEVTSANGLTLTDGVVAYAHNTSPITVASNSNGVVTINGTLTPDTSDALTASNQIILAKVATTGTAADVAIADAGGIITAETVEGALAEIAAEIDGMDAVADSTKTTIDGSTARTAQNGGVFALQAITETDGKITAMTAVEVEAAGTTATAIAGLDASVVTYTTSGSTVTYTGTNNVAVSVTEADGKLTGVTANLYWDVYE